MTGHPSLVWPASASDPNAHTALSVDDLVEAGGAAALRGYIVGRMALLAAAEPGGPRDWATFAIDHIANRLGDRVNGGVDVSAASLQMALAYIEHLEATVARGAA